MNYKSDKQKMKLELIGESPSPASEKCFDLAWEYGHSFGETCVIEYFEDMSEIIYLAMIEGAVAAVQNDKI